MDPGCDIDNITISVFDEILRDYPSIVPDKLSHLDQQRYETLPRALAQRQESPGLTKSEVASLVDWKLSHGKFRPALKGLVQQNSEQAVLDTTESAFSTFFPSGESLKTSINTLVKLRGIGPATASLLLSVYDPVAAPFFSDELFRWCMSEQGKAKGWDRPIKYNLKEYLQLFEAVKQLQTRLRDDSLRDIAAVDIEKVAYVLGTRAKDTARDQASGPIRQDRKRKDRTNEDVDSRQRSSAKRTRAAKSVSSDEPANERGTARRR